MSSEVDEPSSSNALDKRKRKYTSYDVSDKLKILRELDNSLLSASDFSCKCGIDARTIRKWKQQRSKLEEIEKNSPAQRKRQRKALYENVDKALAIWFVEIRKRSISINGPGVQAKAMELAKELKDSENFVASDGWLSKWKIRYGIRSLVVCGGESDTDVHGAQKFKEDIKNEIDSLVLAQIFNADETGLYYKMLPHRVSVDGKEHGISGHKQPKDRITIMVCSNADGSFKLPLVVVGKSANPSKLEHVSHGSFPVYYTYEKCAWMNANIFENWYRDEFIPRVTKFLKEKKLPLKVLLFLDNAPCHPSSEKLSTDDIKIHYLPPNTMSIIQPMNQGIIKALKICYRLNFTQELLKAQKKSNSSVTKFIKSMSIKDVIDLVSGAWNNVQSEIIKKCWKQLLPSTFFIDEDEEVAIMTSDETEEDLFRNIRKLNDYRNISKSDVQDWISRNDNIHSPMPSNEDIIRMMAEEDESASESEEEEDITPQQALSAANTLISYFKKKGSLTTAEFAVLQKCKNDAMHSFKSIKTEIER